MPDINDAAEYFANNSHNSHNSTKKQHIIKVDDYKIIIQSHASHQEIFLFFAEDVQENLKQRQNLLEFLALQSEMDSRFSLIHHPRHAFGVQAVIALENHHQESKNLNYLNNLEKLENLEQKNKQTQTIKKTSFSAQAKDLLKGEFFDSEDFPKNYHNSKPAQNSFSSSSFSEKPAEYENHYFNILEAMMLQADFMLINIFNKI